MHSSKALPFLIFERQCFECSLTGSKPDQVQAMFDEIKDKFGHCDILVNNAGIARDGLMLRMKPEQWQQVIDVNLSGVFYCSTAFFKVSCPRGAGENRSLGKMERQALITSTPTSHATAAVLFLPARHQTKGRKGRQYRLCCGSDRKSRTGQLRRSQGMFVGGSFK